VFVAARGEIIEDEWFAQFLGHCWKYQDEGCLPMVETMAKAGYGLCFVQPHIVYVVDGEVVDNRFAIGYDTKESDSPTNTEVNDETPMDDFIQQCDTYGSYKGMDNLDHVLDIIDRCNAHQDDPEEINQALQEMRRLVVDAINWIEMTTEDNGLLDEGDLFFDGMDEDGGDDYER
jgi:hypothetical protein